jgi:hypothetical protein
VNRAALPSPSKDDLIALILAQHARIEAQAHQISVWTGRICGIGNQTLGSSKNA